MPLLTNNPNNTIHPSSFIPHPSSFPPPPTNGRFLINAPHNRNGRSYLASGPITLAATDKPNEYRGRIVAAGRIRNILDQPGRYTITPESLRDAFDRGLFDGLACFIDHADFFEHPKVRNLLGVWYDTEWDDEDQTVTGTLRCYVNGDTQPIIDRIDQMLADAGAGIPIPDTGTSIVFYPQWYPRDNHDEPLRTKRFRQLESGDFVFFPAVRSSRITEALSALSAQPNGGNPMDPERIRQLLAESGLPPEVQSRLAAQSYDSAEQLNQAIQNARTSQAEPESEPAEEDGQVVTAGAAGGPQDVTNPVVTPEPADGRGRGTTPLVAPDAGAAATALADPAPGPVVTNGGHQAGAGVTPHSPATDANPWLDTIRQEAVTMRLANSGLPQVTRRRLARGAYATPEELDRAIDEARDELAALEEEDVVQLGRRPRGRTVTAGHLTTGMDRVTAAVDWIFGVQGAAAPDPHLRKLDLLYVALTGDVNFTSVFDPSRVQLAGASPVTLPNLAVDAMNKVIAAQFSRLRYWRWYELLAVPTPNDGSLHDMKWILYGGTGNLPIVEDGGPYPEGFLDDGKETDPFEKRGKYVGITRKMIKNSAIQRIQAVPRALAVDAVRTRSAKIAGIFTQNNGVGPTLSDDNPLFHASRNNVTTTALGTDTGAWEAASQECFDHTEIGSGKKIATFAKYNLVPSALYFQALKNFGYGDGSPTTYNPFAVPDRSPEDPRPVVLAVPDWSDANDWAYLADPNIWPVIMITYSQNPAGGSHPAPELFTVISETAGLMFTNDTMPVKVRDEWAAGVNGGAGIGKRNVP